MSQVSAPVSTLVIASDIAGAAAFGTQVLEGFNQILATAQGLGFVTQDPGRPNLTLTLAPDQDPGAPLGLLAKAAAGFDDLANPLRLRTVVHFGVVFRTESADGVSYVGSAIRSTQSALRRAPAVGGILATSEFATYAAKLANPPFQLRPLATGAAIDGLSQLVFGAMAAVPPAVQDSAAEVLDAGFVEFAKRRLTEEIGPFANALVERAAKSAGNADQVIAQLIRDIDNPSARKKFEEDLLRFVKSRA